MFCFSDSSNFGAKSFISESHVKFISLLSEPGMSATDELSFFNVSQFSIHSSYVAAKVGVRQEHISATQRSMEHSNLTGCEIRFFM